MRNPRDFQEFAERLFPGQRIPKQRNPIAIPKDVKSVLDEVSCATGIQEDWLARVSRLVLDGLAGLQCLWFLHGLKGSISQAVKAPGDHEAQIKAAYKRYIGDPQKKKDQDLRFSEIVEVNWGDGYAVVEQGWSNKKPKKTQMKLGKLIHKLNDFMGKQDDIHGFFDEVLQDFEKRQVSGWDWIISAHPFDILTMSHNRPWTSCMKPGGAYEFGPLTDLAAGSALFFFYRPGADKPCGRIILRPAAFGDEAEIPVVIRGIRLYGSGLDPADFSMGGVISEAAGYEVYVDTTDLCKTGSYGRALTRGIYDDTATAGCEQSDTEYDEAYSALSQAPWPESALDVGDIRDRAGVVKELLPEAEFGVYRMPITEATNEVADERLNGITFSELLDNMNKWEHNNKYRDGILVDILDRAFGYGDLIEDYGQSQIDEAWNEYSAKIYNPAIIPDEGAIVIVYDSSEISEKGFDPSGLPYGLGDFKELLNEDDNLHKYSSSHKKELHKLHAELEQEIEDGRVVVHGDPYYLILPKSAPTYFWRYDFMSHSVMWRDLPFGYINWDAVLDYQR